MKVKLVRKPDAKAIAAIHAASFHKGWDAAYVMESMRVEGTLALIAGEYAGFALFRPAAGEMHLLSLAVHSEQRRQGIGHSLLKAVLDQAARLSLRAVHLRVNERNEAALQLYRKNGFSREARQENYFSNPDGMRSAALTLRRDLVNYEVFKRKGQPGRTQG